MRGLIGSRRVPAPTRPTIVVLRVYLPRVGGAEVRGGCRAGGRRGSGGQRKEGRGEPPRPQERTGSTELLGLQWQSVGRPGLKEDGRGSEW
eukprot:5738818-Prymnesium_polylepis.1